VGYFLFHPQFDHLLLKLHLLNLLVIHHQYMNYILLHLLK